MLCAPLEAFFRLPETVRRTAFDAPSPLKEPFKTMPDVPEPPQGFARVAARSSHRKEREERKALGGSWSSRSCPSDVWLLKGSHAGGLQKAAEPQGALESGLGFRNKKDGGFQGFRGIFVHSGGRFMEF